MFPHLKETLEQNLEAAVKYDADKKEHTAYLDFDLARRFVPNHIYKMVHLDNKKFLCEKQVYSDAFYSCTYELLHLAIQQA